MHGCFPLDKMDSSLGLDLTNRDSADPRCPLNLTTRPEPLPDKASEAKPHSSSKLEAYRMHQLHHFTTSSTSSVGDLSLLLT
jgi:hypothetical protein